MKPIMQCSKCHKEIPENEETCPSCGAKYFYIVDESYESNTDRDKTITKGGKMKCRNCNQEIPDDVKFCTSCGVGVNAYDSSDESDGFLGFIAKIYRGTMTLIFIVILLAGPIIGGIIGNGASDSWSSYTFLGVVIGLVVGCSIVILGGGFIATFIEMGENIRDIREDIEKIKKRK